MGNHKRHSHVWKLKYVLLKISDSDNNRYTTIYLTNILFNASESISYSFRGKIIILETHAK